MRDRMRFGLSGVVLAKFQTWDAFLEGAKRPLRMHSHGPQHLWRDLRRNGQVRPSLPFAAAFNRRVNRHDQRVKPGLFPATQHVKANVFVARDVKLEPALIPNERRQHFRHNGGDGRHAVRLTRLGQGLGQYLFGTGPHDA